MTGPIVAALGPFAFTAHGFSLKTIGRSLKTPWQPMRVPGGLDRLQWLGGDSDTVTIEGVLFPAEFGGLASLAGIRAAAEAGVPMHLIQLAGANLGQIISLFVVEGIEDGQSHIGPNGVPMRNSYSLALRRYAGGRFSFQALLTALF